MKDPQYINQLHTTASLADVITTVNEMVNNMNFMWNHQVSGSLE